MLTEKQAEVLNVLNGLLVAGRKPTYSNMQESIPIGRQALHERVLALERKGFVKRVPFARYGLEVIRQSEEAMPALAGPGRKMDLAEACRLLCSIHTSSSDICGFVVHVGERPAPQQFKEYASAWRMIRQLADLQISPQFKK